MINISFSKKTKTKLLFFKVYYHFMNILMYICVENGFYASFCVATGVCAA
jgi:hypothetical protein